MEHEHDRIRSEFARAADHFDERTAGRFDDMDVVGFSGAASGVSVLEVGVGTGGFLNLFSEIASRFVGVDLTPEMLGRAQAAHPKMQLILGDGARLPLRSASIDLVTSAQTFHHIADPMPVLKEMRRVMTREGTLLLVDQVAPERAEEALAMNDLDVLRDPSHAMCRPPSALRIMITAAGFQIDKEQLFDSRDTLAHWMGPEEFPAERIAAVERHIEAHGHETGMAFERHGDDWTFTRRRVMFLARRASS